MLLGHKATNKANLLLMLLFLLILVLLGLRVLLLPLPTGCCDQIGKTQASCAVSQAIERKPSRVKPMTYKIDMRCYLAWHSA